MSELLTIEGLPVPVAPGSRFEEQRIGDVTPAFSGLLRSSIRVQKRHLSIQTAEMTEAEVSALYAVLRSPGALLCGGILIGEEALFHASNIAVHPVTAYDFRVSFALLETGAEPAHLAMSWSAAAMGEVSFTRASTATRVTEDGYIEIVPAGTPRVSYLHGHPYTPVEVASANLVQHSDDLSQSPWSLNGGTTFTPAAIDLGDASLGSLTFGAVGSSGRAEQAISFTGDGAKGISVLVAEGSSPPSGGFQVRVRDADDGNATRLVARISFVDGVPDVAMTAGAHLLTEPIGPAVYRVSLQAQDVVAANANFLDLRASISEGDVFCGGLQAEDLAYCTSYIPRGSAAATRSAESLTLAPPPPMPGVWYWRGIPGFHGAGGDSAPRLWQVGGSGSPAFRAFAYTTSSDVRFLVGVEATTIASATLTSTQGKILECIGVVTDRLGRIFVAARQDGGAVAVSTLTTGFTAPLPSAWGSETLRIGAVPNGTNPSNHRHDRLVFIPARVFSTSLTPANATALMDEAASIAAARLHARD